MIAMDWQRLDLRGIPAAQLLGGSAIGGYTITDGHNTIPDRRQGITDGRHAFHDGCNANSVGRHALPDGRQSIADAPHSDAASELMRKINAGFKVSRLDDNHSVSKMIRGRKQSVGY